MISNPIAIVLLLLVCISSCSQNRTYLTEQEKAWNTYMKGDVLVFESSSAENDTIVIKDVSSIFPDGLGVVDYNERLRILARHTNPRNENTKLETYILSLAARTQNEPSYVVFSLKAKDTQSQEERYSFGDLEKLKEIGISIPYGYFKDVIQLTNNSDYSKNPSAIEIIYWSKSRGYIRFDKYDGTSWKLIKIIRPSENGED